jgi:chorismate mutase
MNPDDLQAPIPPIASLAEARNQIDAIDRQIIALLRRRRALVTQAYAFSSRTDDQQPTDRFLALLRQRRAWAELAGLDPKLVETIFTLVVNAFIAEELAARKRS